MVLDGSLNIQKRRVECEPTHMGHVWERVGSLGKNNHIDMVRKGLTYAEPLWDVNGLTSVRWMPTDLGWKWFSPCVRCMGHIWKNILCVRCIWSSCAHWRCSKDEMQVFQPCGTHYGRHELDWMVVLWTGLTACLCFLNSSVGCKIFVCIKKNTTVITAIIARKVSNWRQDLRSDELFEIVSSLLLFDDTLNVIFKLFKILSRLKFLFKSFNLHCLTLGSRSTVERPNL